MTAKRSHPCANQTCRHLATTSGGFCCVRCAGFASSYPRRRLPLLEHEEGCVLDEQARRGMPTLVHAGDEVLCRQGHWHVVGLAKRTEYSDPNPKPDVARMRFIQCGTAQYYVGAEGLSYRTECRRRVGMKKPQETP